MSAVAWPSIAGPVYPATFEARDPVIRSKLEIGQQAYRRRMTQAPWDGDVEFLFSSADYAAFSSWYGATLYDGAAWFAASWLATLGFSHHQARFTEPYQAEIVSRSPILWRITGKIEVRDAGDVDQSVFHPWRDPWFAGSLPTSPKNAAGTYAAQVLDDAPWGYWKLNEAPGSLKALDSSGNGRDATSNYTDYLQVPCEQGLLWEEGDRGRYIKYVQGNPSGISFPAFDVSGAGAKITAEVWVRPFSYSKTDVSDMYPLKIGNVIELAVNGGTGIARAKFFASSGSSQAVATSSIINPDTPIHLATTIDTSGDGKARLYINGAEAGVAPSGINNIYGSAAIISIAAPIGHMYVGHAAFYGACLTPGRIAAHYNAGRKP